MKERESYLKLLRTETDRRDEKLGYKIREAQMDKVPCMVIVGEKEMANRTVSVRWRDAPEERRDQGEMPLEQLMEILEQTGYEIP